MSFRLVFTDCFPSLTTHLDPVTLEKGFFTQLNGLTLTYAVGLLL